MIRRPNNTRATPRGPRLLSTRRGQADPTTVTCTRRDAETSEWMTERWKHRVEAEARYHLARSIRGIGAAR